MEVYKLEESEEEGIVLCGISRRSRDAAGRVAPGARAAQSFESKGEK